MGWESKDSFSKSERKSVFNLANTLSGLFLLLLFWPIWLAEEVTCAWRTATSEGLTSAKKVSEFLVLVEGLESRANSSILLRACCSIAFS